VEGLGAAPFAPFLPTRFGVALAAFLGAVFTGVAFLTWAFFAAGGAVLSASFLPDAFRAAAALARTAARRFRAASMIRFRPATINSFRLAAVYQAARLVTPLPALRPH